MGKWTRRAFITAGSVVGGGLVLGVAEFAFAPKRLGMLPPAQPGRLQWFLPPRILRSLAG